ncbi:MAG: extracellular solute-binding protein [Nitrospiraceae bacterium]|nr:extracellular solute-binding protein [Nitrospiraceae bacterium]
MGISGVKIFMIVLALTAVLMTIFRPAPLEPANPDAVTITLSFWGSYEEWGMWREIVDLFHADNPDVFVKLNYIPDGYDDKMRLLLAADSAPDIMLIQDEPFPAYAGYGKFVDLTDWAYSEDCPVDWDKDFWPTAAESFRYKGGIYGAPIWGGNVLVYYNREMFREMGVEPPSDDWTFDEFIAKGKELTRDTDGDGDIDTFGFALPGWIYFLPWTWGFGVNYLNETCTDWAFTGPEALAATAFYQDLRFRHHISPSIQEVPTVQEGAMFMTGRIAMNCSGPWNSPGLKTAGIDFDVVHIPFGPNGERATRVTWDSLCMFDKCKNKGAAWRFIQHCISYDAQAIVGKYVRSVPALIEAKDAFCDPDNGWNEEKYIDALGYARVQPISKKWDAMNNVMVPEYERLLLNKITPEECIENMATNMRRDGVFPIKERE